MKLSEILAGAKTKTPMEPESPEEDSTETEDSEGPSAEEISAMKLFSKASSPEQKAEALKMFLKACGVY